MTFSKKTLIIVVLILSLLSAPLAYRANATDWFAALRLTMDSIAAAVAQGAFKAISNNILKRIRNSGLGGGPLFVQDWRSFQLQAQHRGEEIWRGLLYIAVNGDVRTPPLLCKHIRESQAFKSFQPTRVNNLIQNLPAEARRVDSLQEYLDATECDPVVNEKFDIFMKDFSAGGGWDTWERMLQPQNNIYGAIGLAQEELIKQRSLEESARINEPKSGDGFLGIKECLVNGIAGCIILGRSRSPGSTIGKQVASIFDTNMKFYTTADAASLAITLVTEFLVNKMFDSGLSAPSTDASPSSIDYLASYKSEFCSADDNMQTDPAALYIFNEYPQAYAWFPPEEDINSFGARDDNDVGKSYCKDIYTVDDNRLPYTRCVEACNQAVGLVSGTDLIGPEHIGPNGTWVDSFSGVTPPRPPPPEPPSLLSDVQAERAKYGTPMTKDELSSLLNAVAWKNQGAGWGLLSKTSGNNCPFASGPISCDILFHKPSRLVYDVLVNIEGPADPTWRLVGPENDLSRWFAPVQP